MQCGTPGAWIAVVVEGHSIDTKLFPSAAAQGLQSGRVNVSLMSKSSFGLPRVRSNHAAGPAVSLLVCGETAFRLQRKGAENGRLIIPLLGLLLAKALRIPTPLLRAGYRHPAFADSASSVRLRLIACPLRPG